MNEKVREKRGWPWYVWVATAMPLAIVTGMVYAFRQLPPMPGVIPYSGEILLGGVVLVTSIFPLLFAVYREMVTTHYTRELGKEQAHLVHQWLDLSSNRYAIPLSTLVSMILLVSGGVIYWDASYGLPGFGKSWLTVGNFVAFPSSVFEWGFFGAMVYILQDMLRRYIALDLTPRFYFLSTVRILLAITASLLLFAIVQASPTPLFELDFERQGHYFRGVAPVDVADQSVSPFWLLLLSFTAGMFPVKTITSITNAVRNWLSERLTKIPRVGSFFESTTDYSIPLSYVVTPEVEDRLREEGIYCVQNLATAETRDLARRVPYNIAELIDWQNQAMLLCTLGKKNLEATNGEDQSVLDILIRNGYSRFSDLYYLHLLQLTENSQYLAELKKQIKEHPLLLDVLVEKGAAIARKVDEHPEQDVRLAAFEVWYLSPGEIAVAFAQQIEAR